MLTQTPEVDYVPNAMKWGIAAISSLWVGVPAAMQVLVILMAVDYATGIICAAIQGTLDSAEGFRGLARKTLTLLLVSTAWYVSRTLSVGINLGATVAMAFCANELISITENCAQAGVPIPESLLMVVVRAKRLAGRTRTVAEVESELAATPAASGDKAK